MYNKKTPDYIDDAGLHFYFPKPDHAKYGFTWKEWVTLSKKQRQVIRKKSMKELTKQNFDVLTAFHKFVPLSYGTPEPKKCSPKEEKETTMSYTAYANASVTAKSDEMQQREYLSSRLDSTYYAKESDALKVFGLTTDGPPNTSAELVKRIQEGKFELEDRSKDEYECPCDLVYNIIWRDPSVKRDQDGYYAFMAKLRVSKRNASDVIMIQAPADGLKALQDFEATVVQ